MKKIIFFLLLPIFIVSQNSFPKLQIDEHGDTVCVLNMSEVKLVNQGFISRNECWELSDSLSAMVVNYSKLTDKNDKLIGSLGKQISYQDSIIIEKDVVITSSKGIISNKENKIKWLKAQRGFLITLSGILVLIIIF